MWQMYLSLLYVYQKAAIKTDVCIFMSIGKNDQSDDYHTISLAHFTAFSGQELPITRGK